MLREIKDYERSYRNGNKTEYSFHVGMVYANPGVAQASQMRIDEGFANMPKALIEDLGHSSSRIPEYDTSRRGLSTQYEDEYSEEHLSTIISELRIPAISHIEEFVKAFLESLGEAKDRSLTSRSLKLFKIGVCGKTRRTALQQTDFKHMLRISASAMSVF